MNPDNQQEVPEVKKDEFISLNELQGVTEISASQTPVRGPVVDPISAKEMKKAKIKTIILIAIPSIIIIFLVLFFIFRPKDDIVFQKYEEFGPCVNNNPNCHQKIIIRESGNYILEGKIAKTGQLTQDQVKSIKQKISSSKIMTEPCDEQKILMEYNVVHNIALSGQKKEIKAPGCEDTTEQLDIFIEPFIGLK